MTKPGPLSSVSSKQILYAVSTFILSSLYVLILNYFAGSSRVIQKAIVLPIAILLILCYRSARSSWQELLNRNSKWLLLFLCTVFIQLLVLSTGGLISPFLIFIYL